MNHCRTVSLLSCLLMLGTASAVGAESITIGTYNAESCAPFMCNDSGTDVGQSIHYQQVYDASSFSGIFEIGSITFFHDVNNFGAQVILGGTYEVSLSTTSTAVGTLDTTLANNIGADSALFFSGDLAGSSFPSFTIFGTPFLYDPSLGNLLLNIVVTNQDDVPNGSGNGFNQADHTGALMSRAYNIPGLGNGADGLALVTQFNSVPEPATLSLLGLGLAVALRRRMARASRGRSRASRPDPERRLN